MPLFQASVLKKYISQQDATLINAAYIEYSAYFHNGTIQDNIRNSKEEQFQEGFLRELFVTILGYTLNPAPNFNLTTEYKNVNDSKKARDLKAQIDATDKAIDKMVYELYGLSEEEIEIVENS